jgi:hypothetical protein
MIDERFSTARDRSATLRRSRSTPLAAAEAEAVAAAALGFIADDAALLPRFLALTGIDPAAIRRAAAEPGFLAGVLCFVVAHEPTLLAFADQSGLKPGRIAAALDVLSAGSQGPAA